MKFCTILLFVTVALGAAQSYTFVPQFVIEDGEILIPAEDLQVGLLRERRSPQGSIDFKAGVGPGRTGSAGLDYSHRVWRGRNGQSLELGGNYMGHFGNGKPQHNFGIGGTFRF
ncbi:hypothetical protein AAG570_006370 [Ranatra chinensis]|uniref:Uncharacterized protein n=1 Tax=Ranatra chinensis TaxID=642074 RepID=A0ABD0YUF3_9HEMI